MKIELNKIHELPKSSQFRTNGTRQKSIEIFVNSMRSGQKEPISVMERGDGTYDLVDGNHRLSAAKILGWDEIEAEVHYFSTPLEKSLFQAKRNDHDPSNCNSNKDIEKIINCAAQVEIKEGRLDLECVKSRKASIKLIAEKVHPSVRNNKSLDNIKTMVKAHFKSLTPPSNMKSWDKISAMKLLKDSLFPDLDGKIESTKPFQYKGREHRWDYWDGKNNMTTKVGHAVAAKSNNPTMSFGLVVGFNPDEVPHKNFTPKASLQHRRNSTEAKLLEFNENKIYISSSKTCVSFIDELVFCPQLLDGENQEDVTKLIKISE